MTDISRLTPDDLSPALPGLADLLHACVHDGASVGFVLPFPKKDAETFWRDRVFPGVRSGTTAIWVARDEGRIVGTVQLTGQTLPNQTHRADISKMLVHPLFRRRGIARRLLSCAEEEAHARALALLVLDTRSGDPAQSLYESAGFEVAGHIPLYCRNPSSPALEPTTYMFKRLV